MTHPSLYLVVAAVASGLAWIPGNWLLWCFWTKLAEHECVPAGSPSRLVRKVGGLERIIYIMGVVGHHYELITGWLVLKAFFLFLEARDGEKQLERYNGLLIGNALSLIIGVGIGVLANLAIRWCLAVPSAAPMLQPDRNVRWCAK